MASIQLNNIKEETFDFILGHQAKMKQIRKVGLYSLEKTVIKIIEDYATLSNAKTIESNTTFFIPCFFTKVNGELKVTSQFPPHITEQLIKILSPK